MLYVLSLSHRCCWFLFELIIIFEHLLFIFLIKYNLKQALGWRKKQPIAYVFGRTMCITAEDIVNELSEEN